MFISDEKADDIDISVKLRFFGIFITCTAELLEAREIKFLVTAPRLIPSFDCIGGRYLGDKQVLKQERSLNSLSNCRF